MGKRQAEILSSEDLRTMPRGGLWLRWLCRVSQVRAKTLARHTGGGSPGNRPALKEGAEVLFVRADSIQLSFVAS